MTMQSTAAQLHPRTLRKPRPILLALILIALTLAASSASAFSKRFTFPRIDRLPVDKCVQGPGWGATAPERCDRRRQRLVALEICKSKGYRSVRDWGTYGNIGAHSVLYFNRNNPSRKSWRRVTGGDAFRYVVCLHKQRGLRRNNIERAQFVRPTIPKPRRLRIDACKRRPSPHHPDGLCGIVFQKEIADGFCRERGYRKSETYRIEGHIGLHAWFTRERTSGPHRWTTVNGRDAFRSITCER